MSRDALKRLEELSQMTGLHDAKHNMSQLSSAIAHSNLVRQIRMNSAMAKMAAMGVGKDKIDSLAGNGLFDNIVQGSSYAALLGFPQSGGVVTAALLDAQKRAVAAKQGSNKNGVINSYDTAAAGLNSIKNLSNVGKNAFYMSTAGAAGAKALGYNGMFGADQLNSLAHASQNSFAFGPAGGGMLASKMFGGVESLGGVTGGAMSKLLATAGIQGVTINPMLAGVATMMALSKGSSMLHKMVNDKSSINQAKNNRSVIFQSKHPHQLEEEYGATQFYRNLILRMQNTGQIDTQTAILGQILAAIEGHTSVLPLMAAEIVNKEKRSDKQTNKALNHLSDSFGDDGTLSRGDQSKKNNPGILFKVASGLEKFSSQFQSTFDIMGQFSNTLNGKSSTALANEAKEFGKNGDLLEAQKEFGRKYGVSTGMVQAIHTTPSQVMDQADTYEGRVLSILGLISEINRFSAHELLQIRTAGFGLTSASSSSYLAKAKNDIEEKRQQEEGYNEFYERWIKGIDETLGMIPGWNVLSGSAKIGKGLITGAMDLYNKDDKLDSITNAFSDWVLKGHENGNLGSAEQLKNVIGANELSAEQRMATYLGFDYPDKMEELLDYLHSIDESTASMAGNIDRTQREQQTMNNFTGLMGNRKYHESVNDDILEKMENEFNFLDDSNASFLQNLFGAGRDDKLREEQKNKFIKNNMGFMDELSNSMDLNGGNKTADRTDSQELQDVQDAQDALAYRDRQMSTSEKQLATLFEIRDILKDGVTPGTGGSSKPKGVNDDYANLIDGLGVDIDFDKSGKRRGARINSRATRTGRVASLMSDFMSASGNAAARRTATRALLRSGLNVLGRFALPVGAALLGYEAYDYFMGNEHEKKTEANLEKNQDNASDKFEKMDPNKKSELKDTFSKINEWGDDYEKHRADIEAKLKPKSTDELNLMLAAYKDFADKDGGDTYVYNRIKEILKDRQKAEDIKNMTPEELKNYTTKKSNKWSIGSILSFDHKIDDDNNKGLKAALDSRETGKETKEQLFDMFKQMGNLSESDISDISSDNGMGTTSKNRYAKGFANYVHNVYGGDTSKIKDITPEKMEEIIKEIDKQGKESKIQVDDPKSINKKKELSYDANISVKTQNALKDEEGKKLIDQFTIAFQDAIKTTKEGEKAGITASELQRIQTYVEAIDKKSGTGEMQQQFNIMLSILAEQHATTAEALNTVTKLANNASGTNNSVQRKIANTIVK